MVTRFDNNYNLLRMENFTDTFDGNDASTGMINYTKNYTINLTTHDNNLRDMSWDDATWVLTSSFVIFTMQSGFGLLESGMVSTKNEVNIMIKNAVDVIFGGLSFWMVGFGLSFGTDPGNNAYCGVGYFFVTASDDDMGYTYSLFFFQLSFATTATTIVSGAMAERINLTAYILFSLLNTFVYCFPAHWVSGEKGFLKELGIVDIAGAGAVHIVGGVTGLVATIVLGPRTGRFDRHDPPPMGCPTNAVLGMFMLWWGWLGFNCGSTFGISGNKWKLAARAAVITGMSSMAGGVVGLIYSYVTKRKYDIATLVTALLAALVSCTASCAIMQPWEALVIGSVGALLGVLTEPVLVKLKIDDPVGVIPVHAVGAIWSLIAVGLFTENDKILGLTSNKKGIFMGGGWYLLGIQTLGAATITCWTVASSFAVLKAIDFTVGLRISIEEELLGADWVEHGIRQDDYATEDNETEIKKKKRPSFLIKRTYHGCLGVRRRSLRPKKKLNVDIKSQKNITQSYSPYITSVSMNADQMEKGSLNGHVCPAEKDEQDTIQRSETMWL